MYTRHTFSHGTRTGTLETGELARQASRAVLLNMDGTVVLATAVARPETQPGRDFFPLTVDYIEKSYVEAANDSGLSRGGAECGSGQLASRRLFSRSREAWGSRPPATPGGGEKR